MNLLNDKAGCLPGSGSPTTVNDGTLYFTAIIGSYFAWAWSLVVYAPVLIPFAVTYGASPALFQFPWLVALVFTLLLWPQIIMRRNRGPHTDVSGSRATAGCRETATDRLLFALPVGASVAAALATFALVFVSPAYWATLGIICGTGAGIALTGCSKLFLSVPVGKIPKAAGLSMSAAAVFHLPAAAMTGILPPQALVFLTALLPLMWVLPHFGTFKIMADDRTLPERGNLRYTLPGIGRWLTLAGAILFILLASAQTFAGLQQYISLPPAAWVSPGTFVIVAHNGRIYLPQNLLGVLGTAVYGAAALITAYLAARKAPERLFFLSLVLSGLSVAVFALTNNMYTAFISFLLLQGAQASVDVFFWIAVLALSLNYRPDVLRLTGLPLVLYALAGFSPLLLAPPEIIKPPYPFLAAVIFLLAAVTLTDIFKTYGRGNFSSETDFGEHLKNSVFFGDDRQNEADISGQKLELLLDTYNLTAREKEIAVLLLQGRSTGEITEICTITKNTLKTHMRSLLRKTGNLNAKEFALWVLKKLDVPLK